MFQNMDVDEAGKAMLLMRGMQQFEQLHKPVEKIITEDSERWDHSLLENGPMVICENCNEDYPCARMVAVMQMQILGQLTATLSAKLDQLSGMNGLMGIIKGGL